MFQKPKIKIVKDQNDKGLIYFFKSKADFDRCIAGGCKLIAAENAQDASDFVLTIELISSLAVEMWRLDKRIEKAKISQGIDNAIIDQVQRIKDLFRKQEIEICDHTGVDYNDGLSVKALHIEEVENIPKGKMKVIETVKPSIYYKGKVISHGEVIVGKSKDILNKE